MPAILNTHVEDWEISSLQAVVEEEKQQENRPSAGTGKKRKHLSGNEGGETEFGASRQEGTKRSRVNHGGHQPRDMSLCHIISCDVCVTI